MKYNLAIVFLLFCAGLARADHVTAYDLVAHTTDCVDNGIPCVNFTITGSYELNKQGQLVGPWSFSTFDGGISGNGAGTDRDCPYYAEYGSCSYGTSQGYFQDFDPDRAIVDSWLQVGLGRGPTSGYGFDYACYLGECGAQRDFSGFFSFTGYTTIDHGHEHDPKITPIPEPSSLLLTGIGLLGIAAFCLLRR
jgi:hypothetical protein